MQSLQTTYNIYRQIGSFLNDLLQKAIQIC